MTEQDQNKIADLLKQTLGPVDREPRRDLWPAMVRRLEQRPVTKPWLAVMFSPATLASVPWFDWALLALLVLGLCIYPKSIPVWLYHF